MAMKTLNLALVALSLALAGCNTVEGLGKDLKAVGSKIERKAADEKKS
jgi:predicted small secreted protein